MEKRIERILQFVNAIYEREKEKKTIMVIRINQSRDQPQKINGGNTLEKKKKKKEKENSEPFFSSDSPPKSGRRRQEVIAVVVAAAALVVVVVAAAAALLQMGIWVPGDRLPAPGG